MFFMSGNKWRGKNPLKNSRLMREFSVCKKKGEENEKRKSENAKILSDAEFDISHRAMRGRDSRLRISALLRGQADVSMSSELCDDRRGCRNEQKHSQEIR